MGANFVAIGYGYANGGLQLDPSIPVDGIDANVSSVVVRYVRSLSILGNNGRLAVAVPVSMLVGALLMFGLLSLIQ